MKMIRNLLVLLHNKAWRRHPSAARDCSLAQPGLPETTVMKHLDNLMLG
jgi:hypothetical protein